MKKTLLIACLAGLTFLACKKERTCTCTYTTLSRTSTEPGYTYTPGAPTTVATKYEKIKKSNTLANMCVSTESTETWNDPTFTGTVVVNYVVTETSKADCELTK